MVLNQVKLQNLDFSATIINVVITSSTAVMKARTWQTIIMHMVDVAVFNIARKINICWDYFGLLE